MAARAEKGTEQDHAATLSVVCVNQLTEVLVFREEDAGVARGQLDHEGVLGSWRGIGNGHHVMTGNLQRLPDGGITAFVRQETHRSLSSSCLAATQDDRIRVGNMTARTESTVHF